MGVVFLLPPDDCDMIRGTARHGTVRYDIEGARPGRGGKGKGGVGVGVGVTCVAYPYPYPSRLCSEACV